MASGYGDLRPFKVWNCDRQIRKAVVVSSFEELKVKGCEKFGYGDPHEITVVLESDGTEVEDDLYFGTLDKGTVLLLLRPSEKWFPNIVPQLSGNAVGFTCEASPVANPTTTTTTTTTTRKEIPIAPKPGPSYILCSVSQPTGTGSSFLSADSTTQSSVTTFQKSSYSILKSKKQLAPKEQQVSSLVLDHGYFIECGKESSEAAPIDEVAPIANDEPTSSSLEPVGLCGRSFELGSRGFWSNAATKQLIRLYGEFRPQFRTHLFKVTDIWMLVARRMKDAGFDVSSELCNKKWRNLKITYRTISEKMKRGSLRTKKPWKYFVLMRDALSDKPQNMVEGESSDDEERPPDWLLELFRIKKEQQAREMEEIRNVHQQNLEQLKKENESLQLLNNYLSSCSKK